MFYFTLGQREGLNIGGVRGRAAAPWYVVGKDVASNVLYVDQDRDSPLLQSRWLQSEQAHWVTGAPPARRFSCTAQTRYRQPDEPCTVDVQDDGSVQVHFERPQRAVTRGSRWCCTTARNAWAVPSSPPPTHRWNASWRDLLFPPR